MLAPGPKQPARSKILPSTMPPLSTRLRPLQSLTKSPSLAASCPKCLYHSYDHPPPEGPFTSTESKILSASLPHIPNHGFTSKTLALGSTDAGYIPATTNLFPTGAFALLHYHLYTQRIALAESLETLRSEQPENGKPMGVGATVKALTWARLLGNAAIMDRYQEALALMALPPNMAPSLTELHLLSDEIWFLAKDTGVDTSWYTKRASLSTIYASSEVFMTQDRSLGFQDTREFMERRFDGMRTLGTAAENIGQWLGFTAKAGVNVLRSQGVRI